MKSKLLWAYIFMPRCGTPVVGSNSLASFQRKVIQIFKATLRAPLAERADQQIREVLNGAGCLFG